MKTSELPFAQMAEGARAASPRSYAPYPEPEPVPDNVVPLRRCKDCKSALTCKELPDKSKEYTCCWCGSKFDSDGKGGLARKAEVFEGAVYIGQGYYFEQVGTARCAHNGWIVNVVVATRRAW